MQLNPFSSLLALNCTQEPNMKRLRIVTAIDLNVTGRKF